MRKPLVAGNWKMHGSRAENSTLVAAIVQGLSGEENVEVAICPPFVYLAEVIRAVKDTPIAVGAQNVCAEAMGAFTGEVAAAMLRDIGCRYVIVGHSERRHVYREDDALVARKFLAVQQQKLVPILCVGETLDERERSETEVVIARQLDAVLAVAGVSALGHTVIAYEPVWAIGTGKNATPDQAQAVHGFIRGRLARQDAKIADAIRILYGGSVKSANAGELFGMPDVDGGLVGGASLKGEEFMRICAEA
jgi:triosephosphate isomerase (TIM)